MSKTRDTGFLGNVVKVDASGNVSFVSGSTTLATINTSGQLSGSSPVLSASYASNAELLDGLDSTVFTLTSSFNAQTASFNAFSASILTYTGSANNRFSSLETTSGSNITRLSALEAATGSLYSYTSSLNLKTASFATTGSNIFIGTQTITGSVLQSGSFTTTGTIIAQTINVQQVTSSIIYSSGSNIFGNLLNNTQTFTGSMFITGSNIVANVGNACFTNLITACSAFLQVPSTAAVVDILRLNNPAVASSGTRLKFENGYGDLAAMRVTHMDNGSLADDGQIEFQTAQNTVLGTRMTILNTGNVGVNTTTPCAKLDVSYSGTETGVRLVGGGGACCGNIFRSYIADYSDGSPINLFWANHGSPARTNTLVRIHTNETAEGGYPLRITAQGTLCSPTYEALSINYQGRVGIGTTSPVSLLQVNGESRIIYSKAVASNPLDVSSFSGLITVNTNNINGSLSGIAMYANSDYNAAAGIFASRTSGTSADMVFYAGSATAGERMRITSGGLILACGRTSSIMASSGNIQEWVGLTGVIPNNTGWSLFSIANQYDNLAMDIYVFTDVGSFQTSKHEAVFGYTSSTYTGIGFSSAFCIFRTGTTFNETMTICNLSGSQITSQRIAIRVWGYGVGQNGTGGSNLLTTSCLTRIK